MALHRLFCCVRSELIAGLPRDLGEMGAKGWGTQKRKLSRAMP